MTDIHIFKASSQVFQVNLKSFSEKCLHLSNLKLVKDEHLVKPIYPLQLHEGVFEQRSLLKGFVRLEVCSARIVALTEYTYIYIYMYMMVRVWLCISLEMALVIFIAFHAA